ncbi:MAG TPA: hypothetical protein VFN30_01565 [Chitinophagaceae bacterium]|nr:hypothetical protein [Chitinophagaceae bacterium]
MKIAICVLLIFTSGTVFSQDYFPDFRNKRESALKLQQKDIRADISTFSLTAIDESIRQAPLTKIQVRDFGDNFMLFEGENIKVKITTAPFDSTKSKITKISGHVVKINNRPFYGNYGKMPQTFIKEVLVMINNDTLAIPPAAYNDLFNLHLSYTDKKGTLRSVNGVFISPDKRKIYIYLLSKDNNDSYEVTWIIQDKVYFRRALDYGILK